jgi:thymidylate kinase
MIHSRPILISFSGMDGAGKSTQIAHLQSIAESHGLKTTVLTFWDNVVVLSRYREHFVQRTSCATDCTVWTPLISRS